MIKVSNDTSEAALAAAYLRRHDRLKTQIHSAESESDVRQSSLTLFDLDLVGKLEKHRVDYAHPDILVEFKLDGSFRSLKSRCRVISQMLHYIHYIPHKHGRHMLPDTFVLMDKRHALFYDTKDFYKYILDPRYYNGIKSPSSPHPDLEAALAKDPSVTTTIFNILADYELVWSEFEKRGAYE